MKKGLRALLLAQEAIAEIVGARIFAMQATQGEALPYIRIEQVDSDEFNSLDAPTSTFRALDFEIDCKGRIAQQAADLAETVREFLKDYEGPAGSQTIDAVILDEEFDSVEKPFQGSDQKTYVVTLALTIQYHPA